MFSQSVIEQIGSYVYILINPADNKIFYVGKGTKNRVFDHQKDALETSKESDKIDTIRDIINNQKKEVISKIVRFGMDKDTALEVEAALIDFIGLDKLSNIQIGHHAIERGLKTTDEIITVYEAPIFRAEDPCMLINLNKKYKELEHGIGTDDQLYEATRKSWKVGIRREKAKYAIPTYKGLTREVYVIDRWYKSKDEGRWEFYGHLASNDIRKKYSFKSIEHFRKKGAANPIRYKRC